MQVKKLHERDAKKDSFKQDGTALPESMSFNLIKN